VITEQERREILMGRRLWMLCRVDIYRGVTEHDQPKHRMRAAIIKNRLSETIVGAVSGHGALTFATAFELTYGEKLIQPGEVNAKAEAGGA
jgi:hypothetical protein